jgi:hypothetical protein
MSMRTALILWCACILLGVWALFVPSLAAAEEKEMGRAFEDLWKRWKERVFRDLTESSGPGLYSCDEFKDIVALGPRAVPAIIHKMDAGEDPLAFQLRVALARITKKRFDRQKMRKIRTNEERTRVWVQWWRNAEKETAPQFRKLFLQWKELKAQGRPKEAAQVFVRMRDMGIIVLPLMVKKVEQGESDFIAAISELSDGKLAKNARASECLDWWKKNRQKWLLPTSAEN